MKYGKVNKRFYYILGIIGIGLYYLPYFILGEDAAFRISDFLDDEVVQYLLNTKYFFTPTGTVVEEWLSGAPLASIQAPCFMLIIFFLYFSFYHAVLLSSIYGTVTAYFGMFFLCNKLLQGKQCYFSFMAAMLFCILPYYPSYGLSSVGLPLVVWACMELCEEKNGEYKWKNVAYYLVLMLYALSSSLIWAGYFVVGFMILASIIRLICKKKDWIKLFVAAIGMTIIYCFVFRETILSILFSTYVSHRSDPFRIYTAETFTKNFVQLFKYGHYHAPSLHTYIMFFAFCVAVLGFMCYKKMHSVQQNKVKLVSFIWIAAVLIAVFYAFYNCEIGLTIRNCLGSLKSFQLDRIYWTYPMLWYVELAVCASVFFDVLEIFFDYAVRYVSCLKDNISPKKKQKFFGVARVVFMLLTLGFLSSYIIKHPNSIEYHSNIQKLSGKETDQMSYREFYDHELFNEIKDYIGKDQNEYRIGCVGFVPAIASVNGFNTVDGYSTNYPLEYKYKFRKVIEKELEKNNELKSYYDNWGNRCYLFSSELGFQFQVRKNEKKEICNFEINTELLKELGCNYILSAVPIRNANILDMNLLQTFTRKESAIEIYLYELK